MCFLKARTSLSERAVYCCGLKHLACVIRLSTSQRQAWSLQHPLQGGSSGSEQAWPVKIRARQEEALTETVGSEAVGDGY